MRTSGSKLGLVFAVYGMWLFFCVACSIGVLYIALHFILKFW